MTSSIGLSGLLYNNIATSSHDITISLQPCVVNFVIAYNMYVSNLLGHPCSNSDVLVKLLQVVNNFFKSFNPFLINPVMCFCLL